MGSRPLFPYDARRAEALSLQLDCPLEEIKVVEGEGQNVYTRVQPPQTQAEGEEEHGRWLILTDKEFEEGTQRQVGTSLQTYSADYLLIATDLPDTLKLMLRRATNLWTGKMGGDTSPQLWDALEYLFGKDRLEELNFEDDTDAITDTIMEAAELPSEARPLIRLCVKPKPGTDELCHALLEVVNLDKLIELHYSDAGYEGIWGVADYSTQEVNGEDYHLLRKEG